MDKNLEYTKVGIPFDIVQNKFSNSLLLILFISSEVITLDLLRWHKRKLYLRK